MRRSFRIEAGARPRLLHPALIVLAAWLHVACVGRPIVGPAPRDAGSDLSLDLPVGADDAADGDAADDAADDAAVDVPRVRGGGGFDPRVHGFSFANYDNVGVMANLTATEMVRLFGARPARRPTGARACSPPSPANGWTRPTGRWASGTARGWRPSRRSSSRGRWRCRRFSPARAAPPPSCAPRRSKSAKLALWWATQVVPELIVEDCTPAAQTLATLERSLRANSGEAYSLAMWTLVGSEFEGGHAMTPVAVERPGVNQAEVLLYDNNFPGETRRLRYTDVAAGAWTYRTSQNPDAAAADYTGNDRDNPVCLRQINARLAQPARCLFCDNYASPTMVMNDPGGRGLRAPQDLASAPAVAAPALRARAGSASARNRRRIGSALRVSLADAAGRTMGDTGAGDGGIPGARTIRLTSLDPGAVRAEPHYVFPEGAPVRMAIRNDSADPTMMETLDAQFFGPGYALSVEGIDLPPGQTDFVTLAPVGAGLLYETRQRDSAEVVVAITLPGADYRFRLRTFGHDGGEVIGVAVDTRAQVLEFYFVGAATDMHTFGLVVERVTTAGVEAFEHTSETEPGGTFLQLYYGDWRGDGQAIALGHDRNDDGAPDTMEMLPDEGADAGAPMDGGH